MRRWVAHAAVAGLVLLCGVLVLYPPGSASFYPTCPIREYLHLECPGCGATRAMAALLHGELREAIRLNALFVGLLPLGTAMGAECYRRAVRRGRFDWPKVPASVMYALLGVAAIFMLARNMPG